MTVVNLSDDLGDASRARLAELADILIPGGSGLPSASAADVAGQWINRTLGANPGMAGGVAHVLAIPGAPDEVLAKVRNSDHHAYETFVFAVAGAYFMNPVVRNALGYPGIAPRRMPAAEGEAEYYLEDGLLNAVIERGSIYRQAPE